MKIHGLVAMALSVLIFAWIARAAGGASQVVLAVTPVLRSDWLMISQDSSGSHNQPFERRIGPSNVGRLAPKWVATTAGDVSASPVVADGAVYFPDWGGRLWKLDAETGQVIWSHSISEYDGIPGDISR